ncbi:MAG: hypothetical protein KDI90_06435 [Alphaproteobacteria bacterium]|nr:hypothetical protein [Alphaproteobacteria bacterium]
MYCHQKIGFLSVTDVGTCKKCYELYLKQRALEDIARNKETVGAFMTPYLNGEKVDLFAFGYTNPVNLQTIGKDIGQALLSGAAGMAAPFLVKSSDFRATIVLLVLTQSEVFVFTFEEIPLTGSDGNDLYLDTQYFEHYLTQKDVKKAVKRSLIKDIELGSNGLFLTGGVTFHAILASAEKIPGNASTKDIRYKLQGISDLINPADLIQSILEGGALPDEDEQKRMGKNKTYVKELITTLEFTNREKKNRSSKVLNVLKTMHPGISMPVRNFIKEQSKDAVDGINGFSRNTIGAGGIALLYSVLRLVWIAMNEDQLEQGSLAASGLIEFGIIFVATIMIIAGLGEIAENKKRLWYRDNL